MSDAHEIEKAIKLLRLGEVVGLPTETVYGLAARIDIPRAIEKIFKTKERPFFDPLIVHVSSIEQAQKLTSHWGQVAQTLAEDFWPGPLTLVLPKAEHVNPMITSGLESVGVRMPNHSLALEVIRQLGVPLAAPSANKFGRTSPTSALHVWSEFKDENVFVLDGGECTVGIESTVLLVKEANGQVDLSILRKGQVLASDIEASLLQRKMAFRFVDAVSKNESPGHLKHHYMPAIPLVLCEGRELGGSELLREINQKLSMLPDEVESVKIRKPQGDVQSYGLLDLSLDPVVAARELYSELRRLGESEFDCIVFYADQNRQGDHWDSLFDRLHKAASLILS